MRVDGSIVNCTTAVLWLRSGTLEGSGQLVIIPDPKAEEEAAAAASVASCLDTINPTCFQVDPRTLIR